MMLSALILLGNLLLMPFVAEGQRWILLLLLALGWGGELIIGLVLLRQMVTLRANNLLFAQVRQQSEALQREVEECKRIEAQLAYEASHDALTGLANRTLFLARLHHALTLARSQPGYRLAVLFLDLDHFKAVNDTWGHAIGDQLLLGVAQRLRLCLRSNDTLARLGGDEFVILLEETQDRHEASAVADRIQASLQQPFELGGHQLFAAASIGILADASGYDQAEAVLRDADRAMYQAKTRGKAGLLSFFYEREVEPVRLRRIDERLADHQTHLEGPNLAVGIHHADTPVVLARFHCLRGRELSVIRLGPDGRIEEGIIVCTQL
jgi:diguanylate cyclase (GGDEF)-like protein